MEADDDEQRMETNTPHSCPKKAAILAEVDTGRARLRADAPGQPAAVARRQPAPPATLGHAAETEGSTAGEDAGKHLELRQPAQKRKRRTVEGESATEAGGDRRKVPGKSQKMKCVADCVEAVIGAVYDVFGEDGARRVAYDMGLLHDRQVETAMFVEQCRKLDEQRRRHAKYPQFAHLLHAGTPLVEAEALKTGRKLSDWLLPGSASAGRAAPPAKASARLEREDGTVHSCSYFPLVVCRRFALSPELWGEARELPSVLWKLEALFLAAELMERLRRPLGLRRPASAGTADAEDAGSAEGCVAGAAGLSGDDLREKELELINRLMVATTAGSCHEDDNYQLLEYVGDAFLKYAVGCDVFLHRPQAQEGELTDQRTAVVSNAALAATGIRWGLVPYIRTASIHDVRKATLQAMQAAEAAAEASPPAPAEGRAAAATSPATTEPAPAEAEAAAGVTVEAAADEAATCTQAGAELSAVENTAHVSEAAQGFSTETRHMRHVEATGDEQRAEADDDEQPMETDDDEQRVETDDDDQRMEADDDEQRMETVDDEQHMETDDDEQRMEADDDEQRMEADDDEQRMESEGVAEPDVKDDATCGTLCALEETLRYKFRSANEHGQLTVGRTGRLALLDEALTHASARGEHPLPCYQRLEYLGDAVLDLLVARHFHYSSMRSLRQGHLTNLRQAVVSNARLAT
eukprot:gene16988-20193_t